MTIPAGHPFAEHAHHTVHQIRRKLCRWYGVDHADRWYELESAHLRAKCLPDPLGITQHETLEAYWRSRQERAKWEPIPIPSPEALRAAIDYVRSKRDQYLVQGRAISVAYSQAINDLGDVMWHEVARE